jgi:tyrosinase
MIDKVWAVWQEKHHRNAVAFAGGSTQDPTYVGHPTGEAPWLHLNSTIPTDGLFPSATIGEVLSISRLCYSYE